MKHYVKPELKYEKFQLSQHIADCSWELQFGNENECSATGDPDCGLGGYNIFMTSSPACVDGELEGYCYTNSSSNIGLYRS